jgi:multidrug efflux pump subunit AcrA (membrane-fusion protein)
MSGKRNGIVGILIVALVAAAFGVYWQRNRNASEEARPASAPSAEEKSFPVVLTPARALRFEDRITVAGTVLSRNFATVSARIPGTLDVIDVDEGDRVEAGKTRLFQTDRVKVARAVEIARQEVAVAECAVSVNGPAGKAFRPISTKRRSTTNAFNVSMTTTGRSRRMPWRCSVRGFFSWKRS